MKIAITGFSGFIGKYVTEILLSEGYDLLLVGRTKPKDDNKHHTFIQTDLLSETNHSWLDEHRPTHLLHLAWYAEHGKFWQSPLNLDWSHATLRLIQAFCQQGGEKIVAAGTCAEYDWSYGYCKEHQTPIDPNNLYGLSKDCTRRMAEKICHDHKTSFAWGRIFFPFGIGESSQRLIPSLVYALHGKLPTFTINAHHWRDFLSVEMVANGFCFLLKEQAQGIFNICSGTAMNLGELVKMLAKNLTLDPTPIFSNKSSLKNLPDLLVGDNSALMQLGWTPYDNVKDCLINYANKLTTLYQV